MYNWRKMTPEQRDYVLRLRKLECRPWHGPPHRMGETTLYHVTAATYEHKAIIGAKPERLAEFENKLLDTVSSRAGIEQLNAVCVQTGIIGLPSITSTTIPFIMDMSNDGRSGLFQVPLNT